MEVGVGDGEDDDGIVLAMMVEGCIQGTGSGGSSHPLAASDLS